MSLQQRNIKKVNKQIIMGQFDINVLSRREMDIAEKVSLGLSEKEIADELFISPITVHNHTYNIRKKLNARCAVDIARKYILSLENPKKYFAAIGMTIIQLFIILNLQSADLRRPPRTSSRTRTFKTKS